jgi:excisionase family DNA binding protein
VTIQAPQQTRRESLEKLLLTRQEAAEALAISIRKVDLLIEAGDLPAVRIGRSIRIRPSALDYMIEARESRTNLRTKGGRR